MADPKIYYPSAISRLYHAGNVGESPMEIPSIPDGYGCFLESDECGGRQLLVVPVSAFELQEDGVCLHKDGEFVHQGRLLGTYKKGWCITRGFASGKNMNSIALLREVVRKAFTYPYFLKHASQSSLDLLKTDKQP